MFSYPKYTVSAKYCFQILLLLLFFQADAQINFDRIPKDFAIIPRIASTNIGTFRISGTVNDSKFSTIEIRSYVGGALKGKSIKKLNFNGSTAYFDTQLSQIAGLIDYNFQIYLNATLVKEVKSVAFGDIILITGQSNAVANAYNGLANTNYRDSFIRSFGTASTSSGTVAVDTNWYVANGDGYYGKGTVGQWGLVMAKQIVDSMKVPVGIINNAVGGTPITYHKKSLSNSMDLNTSYGRHLYRATKAEVKNKARFMFYYQGESDGVAAKLHDSLFKIMHRDWRTDYPALEKVYVVQVRAGCGSPSLQLREYQRQFEFALPITRTLTMNGFNGHDGCHFAFKNGYEALGFQAANCLLAEFYTKKNQSDIYPLNPEYAYFSKSDFTQITLELNQNIQNLRADPNFYQLFQLEGNPGVTITGGSIINNKIVLTLSGKVCSISGLSYDGSTRTQPWVTNKSGIGLLSFYKLPVYTTKRVGGTVNLCKGEKFAPRIDTIAGFNYLWKGKSSKITSTWAWPDISPTQSEIFELIIQDKLKYCKADTQYFYLNIDSVKNPNLDPYHHVCPGDSLKYELDYPSHSFVWKRYNSVISKTNRVVIKTAGLYTLDIFSQQGCSVSDTVTITESLPDNILDSNYRVCPQSSVTLKSKKPFSRYQWNNDSTLNTDSLVVKKGFIRITAMDSAGCLFKDSALVENFVIEKLNLEPRPEFCDYGFHRYAKPTNCKTWYFNENEIASPFYHFSKSDSGYFICVDSNNCSQRLNIESNVLSKPVQQKYDYLVCTGDSSNIQLNPSFSYKWSDGYFGATKTVFNPGTYTFMAINKACEYEDSVLVWSPVKPLWGIPEDTVICENSRAYFSIPMTLHQVWVNGILFRDSVEITEKGIYEIKGFDSLDCAHAWNMSVAEKKCVSNVISETQIGFLLYPNPIIDQLVITSGHEVDRCSINLLDYTGKELTSEHKFVGTNKLELDLSFLPAGVYIVKIKRDDTLYFYRVFKK